MKIEIRKALVSDYLLLSEFGGKTFYETWRPVNTEDDMQEYIKKAFDPDKIRADLLADTINTFILAFHDKEIVGYAKLRRDRTYEEFKNEKVIEVERIYVSKNWQDKKAGKALMDFCIDLAQQENNVYLWLGVNIDNDKAINFYKRYGFTVFGEKSFQLGNAVDTDFLMKLNLISRLAD